MTATDAEIAKQLRKIAKLKAEFDRAWDATHPPLEAAKRRLDEMIAGADK